MARTVGIGIQDFEKVRVKDCFYVDKTHFIKEWWENNDDVTLIARPRRFGKTLTMSMLDQFFSVKHADSRRLFEGLSIWEHEKYREIQGTYPVVFLSFAGVKETECDLAVYRLCGILQDMYIKNYYLLKSDVLTEGEKKIFKRMADEMEPQDAPMALHRLSDYLYRYYGKKVIILLDEYDTPLQEAYVGGYWKELVSFIRNLFNNTFKTNPYLERAMMTGITRVSRESIFSDLNNLIVVTATSDLYADVFGFTEQEVFAAMDEIGFANRDEVKAWYDGFVFGKTRDIYNPWSIISFLKEGKTKTYWANTSSNSLVGKLFREGSREMKQQLEVLLQGGTICCEIDEEIVYDQLEDDENAVWSLLLASGYIKVLKVEDGIYELALTNYEVERMFGRMIRGWFKKGISYYNYFVKALLIGDTKAMNHYMNRVALETFSSFDTGNRPSGAEPERFYHGFVLGLMVDLEGRYVIQSNRESGFGRYDVMMEPLQKDDDAILLEFKVHDPEDETELSDTVKAALKQIEDKQYEQTLLSRGIPRERIRKYGFAFEGKTVLIG